MIVTRSPTLAVLSSSWTMNFEVRRSVLPYRPCRTCHSTATTMLFCILLLITTPTFSNLMQKSIVVAVEWQVRHGNHDALLHLVSDHHAHFFQLVFPKTSEQQNTEEHRGE